MIDLYAFPVHGNTVLDEDVKQTSSGLHKKRLLEEKMEKRFDFYRFIPYVQLHEFEALLYADISKLSTFYTDKKNEINQLAISTGSLSPEDINNHRETSPSHRIIRHIPLFRKQKSTAGPLAAAAIGLDLMREKCPEFNRWITKLEQI